MMGLRADAQQEIEAHEYGASPRAATSLKVKWGRLAILLVCIAVSVSWSSQLRSKDNRGSGFWGFDQLYYESQTALHHQDPYAPATVLNNYRAAGGTFPTDPVKARVGHIEMSIAVYVPTTLLLVTPLALLSYSTAKAIWILLSALSLTLAGYVMWSVSERWAPILSGTLVCIMLLDCEQMFTAGNAAGIAIGLCVAAAWCFLKNRFTPLAVGLLACSLAIKPHDAGFVWLFFLLSGGVLRRRALQTLAVTCIIGAAAALWIAPVSPHWMHELHENNVVVSQLGSINDPSPYGIASGTVPAILDLQSAFSVFLESPRSYNLASFLVMCPLLAAWMWFVIRRRPTGEKMWLGLAAVSFLTLLPVYHRPYDAKLLLLCVPACAYLWRKSEPLRKLAPGFTLVAVLLTSDIPRGIIIALFDNLSGISSSPVDKILFLSLATPAVLLGTGCFYLWALVGNTQARSDAAPILAPAAPAEIPVAS